MNMLLSGLLQSVLINKRWLASKNLKFQNDAFDDVFRDVSNEEPKKRAKKDPK